MDFSQMYVLPEFGPIISVLDSLLSELNVGLMIYHLEDEADPETLKLVYFNREAAHSTGLELDSRLGKHILDAFPPLREGKLPQTFRDVVATQESKRIEVLYSETGEPVDYSVRAFPMPAHCVGVLFERSGQSEERIGPDPSS